MDKKVRPQTAPVSALKNPVSSGHSSRSSEWLADINRESYAVVRPDTTVPKRDKLKARSMLGQRTPEEIARINEHKRHAEDQRQRQQEVDSAAAKLYKAPTGKSKLAKRSTGELATLVAAKKQAEEERQEALKQQADVAKSYKAPEVDSLGHSNCTPEALAEDSQHTTSNTIRSDIKTLKALPKPGAKRGIEAKEAPSSSRDRDDLMSSIFSRLMGDVTTAKQTPSTQTPTKQTPTKQTPTKQTPTKINMVRTPTRPRSESQQSLTFTVGGGNDEDDEMF